MKIGIANDHHGIQLKEKIIDILKKNNIEYINYGSDVIDNVDYVDYAIKLCNGINNHEVDLGILVCGTGIGMSIVANKMPNIIAAKVTTPREASLSREHNYANVMTLAEDTKELEEIVMNYILSKPIIIERYVRRNKKILDMIK